MKTKNNTQKTVLKSLAVITSFILISLTVSAQDLWQSVIENETAKEIALAIINNNSESKSALIPSHTLTDLNSVETVLKTESENTLELESWMTNEDLFMGEGNPVKKNIFKTATFVFKETKDSKLELEAWMFNPKYWIVRK